VGIFDDCKNRYHNYLVKSGVPMDFLVLLALIYRDSFACIKINQLDLLNESTVYKLCFRLTSDRES
jgi:hypothetical protein